MFDAAAADIILQVEDVVQGGHQVTDVFGRGPALFVKLHNPVENFRGVVHLSQRKPIIVRAIVEDDAPFPVELPLAPSVRKRFSEKPIEYLKDRVEAVLS